jgi:hypothetical protein
MLFPLPVKWQEEDKLERTQGFAGDPFWELRMKKRIIEIAAKVIVAALTAFLTALTTTSCSGFGPFDWTL